jgi:hypothetical protein
MFDRCIPTQLREVDMKKNDDKNLTSIALDPKSLAFLNNAQRVRALGAHCKPPQSDVSDIPDKDL